MKNTALLRFYYPNIDIDKLSDSKWCKLVKEMEYVLKFNGTLVSKKDE